MLIENYDLEVTSPPCRPGAERFNAIARLMVDISQVLPYLDATWKGAIYDHGAHILTWRMGGRAVTVQPYEIAVSRLEDREEAATVIERLVGMINRTWERRDEIEPRTAPGESDCERRMYTNYCPAPTAKPAASPRASSSPTSWLLVRWRSNNVPRSLPTPIRRSGNNSWL
jgi:hypothetical protein